MQLKVMLAEQGTLKGRASAGGRAPFDLGEVVTVSSSCGHVPLMFMKAPSWIFTRSAPMIGVRDLAS